MNGIKNIVCIVVSIMLLLISIPYSEIELESVTTMGSDESFTHTTVVGDWAMAINGGVSDTSNDDMMYPLVMETGPENSTYVSSMKTGGPTSVGHERIDKFSSSGSLAWSYLEDNARIFDIHSFSDASGTNYIAITGYHIKQDEIHGVFGCNQIAYQEGYSSGDGAGYLILSILEDTGDYAQCKAQLPYDKLNGQVTPMKLDMDENGNMIIFGSYSGSLSFDLALGTTRYSAYESPFIATISPWDGESDELELESVLTSEYNGDDSKVLFPNSDFIRTSEGWKIGVNLLDGGGGNWNISQTSTPELSPLQLRPIIISIQEGAAGVPSWSWDYIDLAYFGFEEEGSTIETHTSPIINWINQQSFFMSIDIDSTNTPPSGLSMCGGLDGAQYIIKANVVSDGIICSKKVRIGNATIKDQIISPSLGGEDSVVIKIVTKYGVGENTTTIKSNQDALTNIGPTHMSHNLMFIRFNSSLDIQSYYLLLTERTDQSSDWSSASEYEHISILDGLSVNDNGIVFFAITDETSINWYGDNFNHNISTSCDGVGDGSLPCTEPTTFIGQFDWDSDSDNIRDNFDNCPSDSNSGQLDFDDDDLGDACDDDDDDDGCLDNVDEDQFNDGPDYDGDLIDDDCDPDDDNDDSLDQNDSDDFDFTVCSDDDSDGCDDCSSGSYDIGNDGNDPDEDGICDVGDTDDDNDGVPDGLDIDSNASYVCRDLDADGCDDCSVTGADNSGGDVSNDGLDSDNDGICDVGDNDDGSNDVLGCTYGNATNFDSNATIDNGSCVFEPCEDCTSQGDGDADEDGVPNSQDQCGGTGPDSFVNPSGCSCDSTGGGCDERNPNANSKFTDCEISENSMNNCEEEAAIVGGAGVGLIGGSVITRWIRPKTKGSKPKLDLGRIGDAKDAYDFIAKKDSKKVKTTGGSDHYFKPGVERQGAMSTAADTALDDYVED